MQTEPGSESKEPSQRSGSQPPSSGNRKGPGPVIRWTCVIVWMIVIYAFSHQAYSGRETEKYLGGMNVPIRKLGHIGEYMILFLLLRWALDKPGAVRAANVSKAGCADVPSASIETPSAEKRGTDDGARSRFKILASPSVVSFIIALGYAATDEWHQSYVPGRSATWNDVAVDACGVSLGAISLIAVKRLRKNS